MTQNSEFLFGYTNIIVNAVILFTVILNFVVHKFRQLQEAEVTEQRNQLLSLSTRELCYRFSLDQMKRATNDFDDALFIGKGGFGNVYKGTFEVGPTEVAIKRLHSVSNQGSLEFRTEIEMLSRLRHSHLVSLIGYCDEGYEMILVYELMPGGTLADHLYKRARQGDKSVLTLSWVQRLKICIGAARGLDYLHTGTGIQNRIIHRDVKTTNILLDNNLAAKISDFGLSKISPANQATTFVSTQVKGTFGYLDPYYFSTRRLTRKSDVYSFGVVLFEVLCGRPAVDKTQNGEQMGLAGWAQHCFREGHLVDILDPKIKAEVFHDCLETFVKIAIQCLHIGPKHRPNMAEVVVALESALALQEKSTEYILPGVLTSDDNQDDVDFSKLEVENTDSEKGMLVVSEGSLEEKQSSTRMPFTKRFSVFLALTARALSVNTDAKTSKNVTGSTQLTANLKEFNLIDLERATSNFEEVLGQGSSGKVFKGWVHEKTYAPSTPYIGLPIAVKRFIPERAQGHAEWQMEVDLSRECSHPNMVKLLGYCSEGQEHFLVYEYMQNRNLDTHIFKSSLCWEDRLKILIGAARCLAFFHTEKPTVICRDLKTSRILLDGNFCAKLSPRGLTRLSVSSKDTDVTTRSAETLCYAAPEYVKSGVISVETDVYAFGVVLLEILTGIQANEMLHFTGSITDYNDKEKRLVHYATSLDTYLDPWLEYSFPGGARSQLFPFIASLITKCVDSSPGERPSMLQVVESLELIAVYCAPNLKISSHE
ncbi:uncharacterized protein LOC141677240 [Apium graveolens]|uniref:uncharacterized protein LOC141677240 n=1 Tax=Apium graveolens TaxID=4045 RepID=UPI003D7A9936